MAKNNTPLRTMPIPLDANKPIFEKTQLFICCTRALKYGAFDLPFKIRIPGATGYDLALVARGACVGSIDMTVHVWDVAALWPIIEEAGGCAIVNRSEGLFPLRDHVDYSEESDPVIASCSEPVLEYLEQHLSDRFVVSR